MWEQHHRQLSALWPWAPVKHTTAAQGPAPIFHDIHLSLRETCTNVACLGTLFAELLLWPVCIALCTFAADRTLQGLQKASDLDIARPHHGAGLVSHTPKACGGAAY